MSKFKIPIPTRKIEPEEKKIEKIEKEVKEEKIF